MLFVPYLTVILRVKGTFLYTLQGGLMKFILTLKYTEIVVTLNVYHPEIFEV